MDDVSGWDKVQISACHSQTKKHTLASSRHNIYDVLQGITCRWQICSRIQLLLPRWSVSPLKTSLFIYSIWKYGPSPVSAARFVFCFKCIHCGRNGLRVTKYPFALQCHRPDIEAETAPHSGGNLPPVGTTARSSRFPDLHHKTSALTLQMRWLKQTPT